jgi:acetyl-CoA synthetase
VGDGVPARHDLSSLRLLGSVGEPINPEAWMWYHEHIGGQRCPSSTRGGRPRPAAIMISPLPGHHRDQARARRCVPFPGIKAVVVDEQGEPVGPAAVAAT